MSIYLINIFLIILWAVLLLGKEPNSKKKKIFCIIVTMQWILLSGLRHISVGPDTYTYKVNYFDRTIHISWKTLINNFYEVIFLGESGWDPGYAIVEKIFQTMSNDYQLFLFFIGILFTVPMGIFIYKYSKKPCFSFLIYSCLFYSFFAITGHRQTIATGIALFGGYKFIRERKFFMFASIVLLMSTVHKSVICLLPFYFIATKRVTIRYSFTVFICFIITFIFKNKIMMILASITGYMEYANQFEGAGTWTFTFIFIVVILAALIRGPKILKQENIDITIAYNATFMALIFVPLTFVEPNAMRIVQYFSIFIMILIPEIISSFKVKEQVLVYYGGASLMILLFMKTNPQYMFFWQGGL